MKQSTSKVFMVKPVSFTYNPQTANDNAFQKKGTENNTQEAALREFVAFTSLLKANGIDVVVVNDTKLPFTPDSIFPNNWFSTHEDGTLVLYPVCALNRRSERKDDFFDGIRKNFKIRRTLDLTEWEEQEMYLESTGSMVFDRCNKIVYSCTSSRTHIGPLEAFCKQLCFTPVMFRALDRNGKEIYHTNVMMNIGSEIAVVCLESIEESSREKVVNSLQETGKEIIEISFDQMENFAGNMLELTNNLGKKLLVMSATARLSLTAEQLKTINKHYYRILSPQLDTIEINGGGSARCMMAELF